MIRRGKTEGWLTTNPESFTAWRKLNGVQLHEVKVDTIVGKGSALLASNRVVNSEHGAECLLTVPSTLILSLETVKQHALVDADLREVLDCLGDFGKTAKGAILTFLLLQITTAWDEKRFGVHSPFTFYVKTLPEEALPTTWSEDELSILVGTTLAPATAYKLRSLRQEYENLCEAASRTRWWSAVGEVVDLEDWISVDSMYRSRALDYPSVGHCTVPCMDIANHAAGDATVAVYDLDQHGNAILLLRNGITVEEGQEVTISYGDEKGACEMIFSYGFIDETSETAGALFLDLTAMTSDPLASEKKRVADCAPGVKLIDGGDEKIEWSGDYIWFLCLFEEDGLHFEMAQLTDGTVEVQAFWQDQLLETGAAGLRRLLEQSELWPVWRLRAVSIIQSRVERQLEILISSQEQLEAAVEVGKVDVAEARYNLAMRLRELEYGLLDRAYASFAQQIQELSENEVVQRFLAAQTTNVGNQTEDFS